MSLWLSLLYLLLFQLPSLSWCWIMMIEPLLSSSFPSSKQRQQTTIITTTQKRNRNAVHDDDDDDDTHLPMSRRTWFHRSIIMIGTMNAALIVPITTSTLSSSSSSSWLYPNMAWADNSSSSNSGTMTQDESASLPLSSYKEFQRQKDSIIGYKLLLPNGFQETSKPVKTHLDEINFVTPLVKGYQYGITVDPVKINSLKEFGTPEQVAARVVTAEVNRDGVFEVTLLQDPYEEDDDTGAYVLEYLSVGKRGKKHYYNKIIIANHNLYVLTAQINSETLDTNPDIQDEMKQIVQSFSLLL